LLGYGLICVARPRHKLGRGGKMSATTTTKRLWTAYLIADWILVTIFVGGTWTIIYFLGYKPLEAEGGLHQFFKLLSEMNLRSTLWWRDFLSVGFDILIILLGFFGTWWSLGNFAIRAREQKKWRLYYKSEEGKRDIWVLRFSLWQRIQHIWVIITFILCAFTGFEMYLANNPYWHMLYVSRDLYVRIHVISGWLMGVIVLLHFGYYTTRFLIDLFSPSRKESIFDKWPIWRIFTWQFVKDLVNRLLYTIHPKLGKMPKVHKYDCEEMFEYWGVYWGMAVLGIPGAIMSIWGPQVLNGVFWITHVKEAVLAISWILMVHIVYVHLNPSTFPMDPTYIHGKMPLRRIKEEHPLWYEYLVRKGAVKEEAKT